MVEIIPKKIPKLPGWLNVLFYISLILVVFSILGFFILDNSIKKAKKALISLEGELVAQETPERVALKKEVLNYEGKIKDFSKILEQHFKTSKIFESLEKNCHPRVWFSKFGLNSRQGLLTIFGITDSFESLGQQILIFKNDPLVKNVGIASISIGREGKIEFTLSILVDQKIFK